MPLVAIVTILSLLQFFWLGMRVGGARQRYGVPVPATSGHEIFERHFRVQMNTLEQLALFLPSLWIFAAYVSAPWAAALGAVYIVGRTIYAFAYVREPKSRGVGFALSAVPTLLMMMGILIWAVRAIILGAAW